MGPEAPRDPWRFPWEPDLGPPNGERPGPGPGPLLMGGDFVEKCVLESNGAKCFGKFTLRRNPARYVALCRVEKLAPGLFKIV